MSQTCKVQTHKHAYRSIYVYMKALHSKIIVSMVDTGSNPTAVYHNAVLDACYTLFNRAGKTYLFTQHCPKPVI